MPLFPTIDLQNQSLKSAKSNVIKTIQENRSYGIFRMKFITGDGDYDEESIYENFPKWMSDYPIKNYVESCVRNDESYMVHLKEFYDDEESYNSNSFQQRESDDDDGDSRLILDSTYSDEGEDQEEQFISEELKKLKRAAEQGDVSAQLMIGNILREGKGVAKDEAEAFKWFTYAANESDNPEAQYNVGLMYLGGNGVERDVEEAYRWLKKSASKGSSDAQLTIGNLLYEGKILDQDTKTAVKLFRLAAKQNNIHAQMIMGEMYLQEQNDKKAVKWIKMAAELENPDAQFMLAKMYAKGKGITQDYAEAIRWFKRAAAQGHHEAGIVSEALT